MTREEAIYHLYTYSSTNGSGQTTDEQHNEAKRMAIKALEQKPTTKIEESNFSQEQYKADLQCAYDCGKSVIDKIRAEIKAMGGDIETISDVLAIIDKHMESEGKE